MKKYFTSNEYKKRNTKRAADSLKQRLKSDAKRKAKRKKNVGLKKDERKKKRVDDTFVNKKAPPNFSFVENTEAVLQYLEELKTLFKRKQNVMINLRDVTNLTNDAIVLLLSFVKNPKIVNGVAIKGNYPSDERLRKIFVESGVFNQNKANDNEPKNYILTRQNKKAEGGIAAELIKRSSKEIFGEEGRCPGIYRALMESMANTCYHAKPQQIGHETWWLTVYHDREHNHVSFAFIDLGVGIFKSSKMNDFKAKAAALLGLSDNRDILKEIISGRKLSSTKIPYRGKGLPTIFKGLERNYYSNLKIISNDVKADLSKDEYVKLKTEFSGTFLYWELNNTNRWTKS
jgi:hypothetical protein